MLVSVSYKSEFCRNVCPKRAGFWRESFLPPVLHTVIKGIASISKNKDTFLRKFVPNTGLFLLRHIDRRNVLLTARRGGHPERDKLDRRRSAKLTVPPNSDSRPLVYHSNYQALSTARFRRAGLLATADTCLRAQLECRACSWRL